MALINLPPELVERIIQHTLPEGFESLALSCKGIYALCRPFIEHHNHLRLLFQNFHYGDIPGQPPSPIRSAADLLARIAAEPVVARYIRTADFGYDSCIPVHYESRFDRVAVAKVISASPYMAHAGLDCEEYTHEIEKEIPIISRPGLHTPMHCPFYSQHAAAFLLTLLPNIEEVQIPQMWSPVDATDRLIDTIVGNAKAPRRPGSTPSLAQVVQLGSPAPNSCIMDLSLPWLSAFLSLPQIHTFYCSYWVATDDDRSSIAPGNLHHEFGETLAQVSLSFCCVDEVTIGNLLKHTPRLKIFGYSHLMKPDGSLDWNICEFITAIESQVWSHLEELGISICEPYGPPRLSRPDYPVLPPGRTSMHRFQRLRKLAFPLEVVMCILDAIESQTTPARESSVVGELADLKLDDTPWIGNLVPSSLSELVLSSRGADHHEKALDALFHDFAARKGDQMPALTDVEVSCPRRTATDAYKVQCQKLSAELGNGDVNVHVRQSW